MLNFIKKLRNFRRNQGGAATVEFVIVFPLFFLLVAVTFDSGLLMSRYMVLENSLDNAMRQVRLGGIAGGQPGHDLFKSMVCETADKLIDDCYENLSVEMVPVSTSVSFSTSSSATCVDRASNAPPAVSFTPGVQNDVVYVRACILVDRIMPSAISGVFGYVEGEGIPLIAESAYVVEPS